jgi:hypothetical protein
VASSAASGVPSAKFAEIPVLGRATFYAMLKVTNKNYGAKRSDADETNFDFSRVPA